MRILCATVATLAMLATHANAAVKVPNVISSHMVLQREREVPIWGTADPGEKVVVKFRDQEKMATADNKGKWSVKLDALKVGEPAKMTITGTNSITLDNVLVGEVWIGSGQSNMAGIVKGYSANDEVLAKMATSGPYPKIRLLKSAGAWQEATEANVNATSAILFAFGLQLQKELDCPVGLMLGAVGGTPSGYWLSEEAYTSDEACKEQIKAFAKTYSFDAAKKKYDTDLIKWTADAEIAKTAGKPAPRKPDAPLQPGEVRGKVGNLYEAHIRPMIPFAIRGVLWDQGESGTAALGVDQFTLMGALIRGWRKDFAQGDFPFICVQKPSGGGCAWNPEDPITMRADKFAPLPAAVPMLAGSDMRPHYLTIMKHPQTFIVTASDLGSGIHPVNKSGYGIRSAQVASGGVYGKKVEIYGPIYTSHKIEGDKVRIQFTHTGKGLAFKHGEKLQGFAIAGKDGKYEWAEAVIDGDDVVLTNAKVKEPMTARYAWASTHPWANLFNKDGLPALPFQTETK